MTQNQTHNKYSIDELADERQKTLYQKFTPGTFLSDPINVDHILRWITFFRRNLHRLAIDYLGINLHPYQALILYIMGICQFVVIVACRAAAKSFIIALYACCRCIVYGNAKIVLSSAKNMLASCQKWMGNKSGCIGEVLRYYGIIPRAAISNAVCNA